jgi:aminopeptidase N
MPTAEITRVETAERARLLRVESYNVSLDLTRGSEVFGSVSVISFGCTEPGASTYVDLIAAAVHEITLNGVPVDPALAWADGRIALSGLAARNELRIAADCEYTNDGSALDRSVDSSDGKVYLFTTFEPADARKVYANFEQPDLKAAFILHVTAPAHWTVLSNQPSPEPGPADGSGLASGSAVWHFPPTPRISTYLTAMVAGEYHMIRDSHTTAGGQVIPLGLACRASLAQYLDAGDIFDITRRGLDFYEALFGTGYPFAKYDQVFVPDLPGAMENPGCVPILEQLLFRSKVTDTMYELRAVVILHEMAHMWFGDLVTMKWWDDLWLNESFAEFCAMLSAAEATRFTGAFTSFAVLQGAASAQHPTLRPHHIAIGLYHRSQGALTRAHRVEADVTGQRTEVPDLVGLPQPDLILLNDDDLGYAIVRFDPRSLATLTEAIGEFTDSLARAVCWAAVIDMVQEAELSLPAFVRLLAGGMAANALGLGAADPARGGCSADHGVRRPAVGAGRQAAARGRGRGAAARGRAGQRSPARLGSAAGLDRDHWGAARPARRAAGRQRRGIRPGRGHRAALGPTGQAGDGRPGWRGRDQRRTRPGSDRPGRAACGRVPRRHR